MDELVRRVYILAMLLAYVMRRAGTFTMQEKVRMLEFAGQLVISPSFPSVGSHEEYKFPGQGRVSCTRV